MRVLGFIPARGGSKGLPRKNLIPLAGRPLLVHTIQAARASELLDRVVVSTDDQEIAAVATNHGVEVIARPAELAADNTLMLPVVLHALEVLADRGYLPTLVVTLHPTSPFRSPTLIDRAIRTFAAGDVDSVLTVRAVNPRIGWLQHGLFVPGFDPERPEPVYVDAGAVYVNRVDQLTHGRSFVGRRARAIVLDKIEGLDLNTPADLEVAACIIEDRGR